MTSSPEQQPMLGVEDIYWLQRIARQAPMNVSPNFDHHLEKLREMGLARKTDEGWELEELAERVLLGYDRMREEQAAARIRRT